MKLAAVAFLAALVADSASAQIVFKPTTPKPDVAQGADDRIRLKVDEVGAGLNQDIRALPDDTATEADKQARGDRDPAKGLGAASLATKPCKDCALPAKPH